MKDSTKAVLTRGSASAENKRYVVVDIETTGFSPTSDKIIEIGAIKIENGAITEEFHQLINPGIAIPARITDINGIASEMVADKPMIEEVLPLFMKFCADCTIVAHNAKFDMGFVRHNAEKQGLDCNFDVLDTLEITRLLFPDLENHKLDTFATHLDVELVEHHRAMGDAKATAHIFLKCGELCENSGIVKYFEQGKEDFCKYFNAKTYQTPKRTDNAPIKRVELHAHTKMSAMDGMISARDLVERAAEWGHKAIAITDHTAVTQAFPEAYRASRDKNIKIIYGSDFLVNDDGVNFCVNLLAKNTTGLKNLYKIVSLANTEYYSDERRIPDVPIDVVLANREGLLIGSSLFGCDVYAAIRRGDSAEQIADIATFYDFIEVDLQDDESINTIAAQIGQFLNKPVVAVGNTRILEHKDKAAHRILYEIEGLPYREYQAKNWHFMTTEEMLHRLAYLGEDKAYDVVVTNSNLIADMIEEIPPVPKGFFLPTLDGAEEEMVQICNTSAKELYGNILPDNMKKRLDYEFNSILENGYAVIYMIAQRLVKKSNDDGYMVGSRGSVGASFVAYLLGITEIDPLIYNIPFEVFAGLDGDKMPDIDLNFSGDYQAIIQKYVGELFGKDKVFRAGTISTTGERVAMGMVLRYFEDKGITPAPFEVEALASDLIGIKRTTGQHPGGLMIIPADKEIYDFTPVQYPGNKKDSGVVTTHFEYSSLDNTLLKFDLLGHDSPTLIKKLEDLTGVDVRAIPLDDEKTLDMLINTDALGVPEFSADFVRNMITTANPKTFNDFVKISGLSHGTDVWCDNAENLIKNGIASISEVIALRDEIMVYLMDKGICRETAFYIMENIRKGRGLSDEHEDIMSKSGVPEWYIESCNKIRYMFPKAHAVAYTIMAFRIAWFKAHHPEAFYSVAMEIKDDLGIKDYDISDVKKQIEDITAKDDAEFSDRYALDLLRLRLEMLERSK